MDNEGTEYSIPDSVLIDREGEDGTTKNLHLNSGDIFIGESVESQWRRGWDANISTFTAILDSTNDHLELSGLASVAGTGGAGWINSQIPMIMVNDTEITVKMQLPTNDTGVTANRDIRQFFYLKEDKDESDPASDNNFFTIYGDVNETGTTYYIVKEVNGASTTLAFGHNYQMAGSRGIGAVEATIWRLVFNGKPGTSGATISIYLKQDDSLAAAEIVTEYEVVGSPFDISDLAFYFGYPAFRIWTQDDTNYFGAFGSGDEGIIASLQVTDPQDINIKHEMAGADIGKGDVVLYDDLGVGGTDKTAWLRVYDADHVFTGDAVIDNGLVRTIIDEAALYGVEFYGYINSAWTQLVDNLYFIIQTDNKICRYPFLRSVIQVTPEEVILRVRMEDSATQDGDYFCDLDVSIERGSYSMLWDLIEAYPLRDVRFWEDDSSPLRFGYVGNNAVGDDDMNLTGDNTTLSDNFMTAFDDTGSVAILQISTNQQPSGGSTQFRANDGGDLSIQAIGNTDFEDTKIWISYIPFSLVANLFEEAEDATLAGGATSVVDPLASGGNAVLLNAQNERVYYDLTAGTDAPAGNYLVVWRIRDTNQIADDVGKQVLNNTDNAYRIQENIIFDDTTVTATYAYYSNFFYISDADVTGGDIIRLKIQKRLADANEVYVDYFLIFYLGDGENGPQVSAHNALRNVTKVRRVIER